MNEKMDLKKVIIALTYLAAVLVIAFNLGKISGLVYNLASHIKIVIYAIALAFVLNIPMKFFEKLMTNTKRFGKKAKVKISNTKQGEKEAETKNIKIVQPEIVYSKLRRVISITITTLFVILVVSVVIYYIVPQLALSMTTLVGNLPSYFETFKQYVKDMKVSLNISDEILNEIIDYANKLFENIKGWMINSIPDAVKYTQGIASGIIDFMICFIIAIYMLLDKERIGRNVKRTVIAFTPKKSSDYILKIAKVFKGTFNGFVTGQLTEACIIGALCYIGMRIFNFPYAELISSIITITAIVPIFGAFIGAVPSAFILFMISPMQAVWFIVFIFVLQQIEGNLIYPRVVGTSIGISGLWVLVALVIGSSMGGIVGVLIGIPTFAAIYIILKEEVDLRLKARKIDID